MTHKNAGRIILWTSLLLLLGCKAENHFEFVQTGNAEGYIVPGDYFKEAGLSPYVSFTPTIENIKDFENALDQHAAEWSEQFEGRDYKFEQINVEPFEKLTKGILDQRFYRQYFGLTDNKTMKVWLIAKDQSEYYEIDKTVLDHAEFSEHIGSFFSVMQVQYNIEKQQIVNTEEGY